MGTVVFILVVGVVVYVVRKNGGVKASIAKVKAYFKPSVG